MKRKSGKRKWGIFFLILFVGIVFCGIGFFICFFHYNQIVRQRFEGKKWELPARIYARPLELYPGMELKPKALAEELHLMQYRRVKEIDSPGSFSFSGNRFEIFTRGFLFEDGEEPSEKIQVVILKNRIKTLTNLRTKTFPELIRLDPALIGSFYPTHNEDRILVRLDDVNSLLVQTLLAVEDRNFYKHRGVSPLAIFRALVANIRSLRTVQGGSTLTQQLVKNFFLTREQTLKRKFEEAFIALSLEWNYDKDEILEAYLNEVYMGQDGKRAIHGFGLGSLFYFGRSLNDLRAHEIAMLVGLLKGPSHYDPRQFPERAMQRRNVILEIMKIQNIISDELAQKSQKSELGVIDDFRHGTTPFPAFLDLIKRQLLQEYDEKDLRSEGLRIFTSFDPQIQLAMEKAVTSQMKAIESQHAIPKGKLEVSAMVTSTSGNEILALMGGRNPRSHGFNRALDAKRSIGSLVKPAIYLTALQLPEYYTLMTMLDDSELYIESEDGKSWTPQNYDHQYHGSVPLYLSLVHSYNIATVRLGLILGLDKVFQTIEKMGIKQKFQPYPSSLLGTMGMSSLEVCQMYQTLASGGFYSPIRAIRSVFRADGVPLQRFSLTVRQNFDPGAVYLLNKILQAVVVEGTATSLKHILPQKFGAAGKTGTTDDLKDSWFAGFTGNYLSVVWIGRDDNQSCGLTGASGALQVWGKIIASLANKPLKLPQPENVEWAVIDKETGVRTQAFCENVIAIPFIIGSAPLKIASCEEIKRITPQPSSQEITTSSQEEKQREGIKASPPEESLFIRWLKEVF